MVAGVPHHVDGRMIAIAQEAGAAVINADRMWHYTEGVTNWAPIWPNHGIRILPGPSSMWFDAKGERLEAPFLPGFDTLGTLRRILSTGYEHSWFVLTPGDHQEGIRAVGLRAEPRHDLEELARRPEEPARRRRAAAGRGVQAARARTSSCATICAISSPA